MKKSIAFLQNSNHYKHLIDGFIVSWLTASLYAGIYAAVVAAICLELKDRLYGNKFNLTDWLLTVVGGAMPDRPIACLLLPITTHKKYKEGRRGDNGTSQPGTIPKLLHLGSKLHFSCHAP